MEDTELIKRIKKGETGLLDILISKYYPDIYRYCYKYISNKSDAEDITQEVFVKFCGHFDEYVHKNKCKNYLYVIAGNLCKNALAKKKTLPLDQATTDKLVSSDEYAPLENELVLETRLKSLPVEQQELLLLRYYQDLKISEIAQIKNIPVSTTKYKLQKSIESLKLKLIREDWI